MHRAAGVFVVAIGFMSAIAMLIQKTEKPEWNLVPQHILLVGRGDFPTIGVGGQNSFWKLPNLPNLKLY
jgi:hypothetical protein